jgi:hypothetical protein
MPRYFFNVSNGQDLRDGQGLELPNDAAARLAALEAAGEMLRELGLGLWDHESLSLQVVDETGAQICRLRFAAELDGGQAGLGSNPGLGTVLGRERARRAAIAGSRRAGSGREESGDDGAT